MEKLKTILILLFIASLLLIIVAIFEFIIAWSPWLLLLPFCLLIAVIVIYKVERWHALKRKGFFIRSGTAIGHRVIYEEKHGKEIKSVALETENFEPGRDYIVIPTREKWNHIAPEWAKDRRDEIFSRAIKSRPEGCLELPADWPHKE